MLALKGIYENDGTLRLERPLRVHRPQKVIVTFIEDDNDMESETALDFKKFSFQKARNLMRKYNFSLSDTVIDLRNED